MSNLLKKEKGFTLIEIVLVLAIAGLIMVIVFLAVSGAQKSRRDTQRKNDLSRIAAQVESFASNKAGVYPTAAEFSTGAFKTGYIDTLTLNDPLSGAVYTYGGLVTPAGATSAGVAYALGTDCAGGASGTRVFSVSMSLEQGSACRDNK